MTTSEEETYGKKVKYLYIYISISAQQFIYLKFWTKNLEEEEKNDLLKL